MWKLQNLISSENSNVAIMDIVHLCMVKMCIYCTVKICVQCHEFSKNINCFIYFATMTDFVIILIVGDWQPMWYSVHQYLSANQYKCWSNRVLCWSRWYLRTLDSVFWQHCLHHVSSQFLDKESVLELCAQDTFKVRDGKSHISAAHVPLAQVQ